MIRLMRVLKFGGSSLSSPEKILHVAKHLAAIHSQGQKLVTVVSAMGESTNQLLELAYSISKKPDPRELDMLLTTGERVSMALLSMALRDLNCPSISFTGSQAGILTDASHFGAKIKDIRPIRVQEALKQNQVVVIAGFQGIDPNSKEITTLGRGGSDTTAVAMAAYLGAASCELLKDIDCVYSAEPKLVKNPIAYSQLPHEVLYDMCFWGAKILHYRSVELALRRKLDLNIGSSLSFKIGTKIQFHPENKMSFEDQQILAVNSHALVDHIFIEANNTAEALNKWRAVLKDQKVSWPQIIASAQDKNLCRFMYSSDKTHLEAIRRLADKTDGFKVREDSLSSISLTCYGSVASDLIERVVTALGKENISVEKTVQGPLSISLFVLPENRERAINILHSFVTPNT